MKKTADDPHDLDPENPIMTDIVINITIGTLGYHHI